MRAVVIKCEPNSQFHFGHYAPDSDTALNDTSEVIHSDTLFSALVRTYNEIYPNSTDEFVDQFRKRNIRISSAYFYLEHSGGRIWFLPKPVSFNLADSVNIKKLKKIKYLSKEIWDSCDSPKQFAENIEKGEYAVIDNEFAIKTEELPYGVACDKINIYHIRTNPKVHVRKPTKDGSIYNLSTVEIADNSTYWPESSVGFYFLYDTSIFFGHFQKKFDMVLDILSDSGIGAERSTIGKIAGITQTEWKIESRGNNYYATLSLVIPDKSEFTSLKFYQTIFRGGRRIGNNTGYKIQRTVRMLTEGSIVKDNISGVLADVTPASLPCIYLRNGMSLNLPIPDTWIQE